VSAPAWAVVLAGGTSRRWDGRDKTRVAVDGRTVLDRVLGALPAGTSAVVVGEPRETELPVTWTREDPPGGGPAAGLHAGLRAVPTGTDVLLLAADLARVDLLVPAILRDPLHREARVVVDEDGRAHWTSALLSARGADVVRGLADLHGASLREVFARLDLEQVPAPRGALDDLDSPADLQRLLGHDTQEHP
jgi:molybdopterin-guanine dinucleotide biosynthesis protein A